jgi:hypothetical protein
MLEHVDRPTITNLDLTKSAVRARENSSNHAHVVDNKTQWVCMLDADVRPIACTGSRAEYQAVQILHVCSRLPARRDLSICRRAKAAPRYADGKQGRLSNNKVGT